MQHNFHDNFDVVNYQARNEIIKIQWWWKIITNLWESYLDSTYHSLPYVVWLVTDRDKVSLISRFGISNKLAIQFIYDTTSAIIRQVAVLLACKIMTT